MEGCSFIEIVKPFETESYSDYIQRIINIRPNIRDSEYYQELHHIIPKCIGGTNEKDNLVYLYAEEHYYAHKLLSSENKGVKQLQYAWWNMCQARKDGRSYNISAEDYAEARQRIIPFQSEYISTHRTGENNPNFGKHFSEEHKRKLSQSHIGLPKSEKTIRLISENHADVSGGNNPRAVAVECIENGAFFETQTKACQWANLSLNTMKKHLEGKTQYGGKNPETGEPVHWKYAKQ